MKWSHLLALLPAAGLAFATGAWAQVSPAGVKTLAPCRRDQADGNLEPRHARRRFRFRGGHARHRSKTNALVQGEEARVMQAFVNMKLIAESEGATLARRGCGSSFT
jgi:hypothetical protein